jgi:hypothetical protein
MDAKAAAKPILLILPPKQGKDGETKKHTEPST